MPIRLTQNRLMPQYSRDNLTTGRTFDHP